MMSLGSEPEDSGNEADAEVQQGLKLLTENEIKQEIEDDEDTKPDSKESIKQSKPGIIYLSTIPPGMNVKQIREYFTQFGEINRSFIQPEKKKWKTKGKVRNQTFTEGWIEFRKRRKAKRVAEMLNNTPFGGKKTKVYHDFLWSIKYLPGFQWVHLNERLAYERISLKQKLRAEISAAKREANFFAKSVDRSKKFKKLKNKDEEHQQVDLDSEPQSPTAEQELMEIDSQALEESTEDKDSLISSKSKGKKHKDRGAFFKSLFTR